MQDDLNHIIYVSTPTVSCDGGPKHLGHPLVYLDLPDLQTVACPYCSQLYCLNPGRQTQGVKAPTSE